METFKNGVLNIARRLGYSSDLYTKTNPDNQYRTMGITFGTPEAALFKQLTQRPIKDVPTIGKGEAAALVLAKANNGIIAINNLRDITDYANDFGIQILTAADILVEALGTGFINETEEITK